MNIDFATEFKKQLLNNVKIARKQINQEWMRVKIQNWCEKFEKDPEKIKEKILNDDDFTCFFAKDPSKQNFYEKTVARNIKALDFIENFVNYSNSVDIFVVEGKVTNERKNDVKSVDFFFTTSENSKNLKFYCSHKFIKDTQGGAQDNQYNDIRNFLRNCDKISGGDNFFIAICDGAYFQDKIDTLNAEFGSSNVFACSSEQFDILVKAIIYDEV